LSFLVFHNTVIIPWSFSGHTIHSLINKAVNTSVLQEVSHQPQRFQRSIKRKTSGYSDRVSY